MVISAISDKGKSEALFKDEQKVTDEQSALSELFKHTDKHLQFKLVFEQPGFYQFQASNKKHFTVKDNDCHIVRGFYLSI